MSKRKKHVLIGLVVLGLLGFVLMLVVASILSKRFEPYIREQAILYLTRRFDSQVELAALRVRLPRSSPLHLLWTRGRGGIARVEGAGLSLRHKGRRDLPPMLVMNKFSFDVELGSLFSPRKIVPVVKLDGMEINVPPAGDRPNLTNGNTSKKVGASPDDAAQEQSGSQGTVVIQEVLVSNATLRILPRNIA